MNFIRWMIDSLASEDVIDGYFVLTDLKDINLTDEERQQTALYDSLASDAVGQVNGDRDDVPMGKRVY